MKRIRMKMDKGKTFKEGFEDFLFNCKARGLREGTLNHYEQSYIQLIKYIDENISNIDINVNTLAERYGCSTEHFRHKFRKEFNISPQKYILINRLNFVKELLLNSSLSIANIAQQSGFSDSNYFSRYFKRITGYTPTQFKTNSKKFL